ncbi:MAG: hypothetical protein LBB23_01965 [Rickettsiales bacterium]|jgi:hypothetical protein|nr:hypothetical protein [Rickettsiales bacterium]
MRQVLIGVIVVIGAFVVGASASASSDYEDCIINKEQEFRNQPLKEHYIEFIKEQVDNAMAGGLEPGEPFAKIITSDSMSGNSSGTSYESNDESFDCTGPKNSLNDCEDAEKIRQFYEKDFTKIFKEELPKTLCKNKQKNEENGQNCFDISDGELTEINRAADQARFVEMGKGGARADVMGDVAFTRERNKGYNELAQKNCGGNGDIKFSIKGTRLCCV